MADMTNYERIKNMTIEGMSEFLMDWVMKIFVSEMSMNVKTWLESEVQG